MPGFVGMKVGNKKGLVGFLNVLFELIDVQIMSDIDKVGEYVIINGGKSILLIHFVPHLFQDLLKHPLGILVEKEAPRIPSVRPAVVSNGKVSVGCIK